MRRKLPVETLESRILLANQLIWMEGESPAQTTFIDYWLRSGAQTDKLSGGDWLVHTNGGTAFARYNFTAPEAGTYQFWLRLQTYNANYSYQLDSGTTVPLSMADVATGSPIDAGYDGYGYSNRQVGWVYAGAVNIPAGNHQIRVNTSGNWGGVDAIGLANYNWVPSGPVRPDPAATPAATDWFPFTAHPDDFSSNSLIDLSYLNEDTAGMHGFVTRVGDHYEFANQPGVPVKFWGIDAAPVSDPANIQAQARWYAKNGINIVRLAHFDDVFDETLIDANGNPILDAATLDRFDRFFAALKDNGIYMDWSMVWRFDITPAFNYPLYNELPYPDPDNPTPDLRTTYCLDEISPQLQQYRLKFVSALLNHVNPYTGMKYATDPALAVVECQNESSFIFWTGIGGLFHDNPKNPDMPQHMAQFKLMWQQWVKTKYGNDTALRAAWGSGFRTGEDGVDATNMKVYNGWELDSAGLPGWEAQEQARAADYTRFLGDLERNYYTNRIAQIRSLGFQGVMVTSNWMGSGAATTLPNLWADQAGDAVDRHAYWQGGTGSWRIVTPDGVNGTMLKDPSRGLLEVGMSQVENQPFNYSEWSSTPPNWYQAEAAPLVAFYGMGLQGWDASFQFASSHYYSTGGYNGGYNDGYVNLYNSDTPVYMGQFPALSLAVRRGDITQGGEAAARRITMGNAFSGKDATTQSLPNNGWDGSTGSTSTPNQVLAVGRVTVKVGDGQAASQRENWSTYWNQGSKLIASDTGELLWDYNKGLIQVMAEETQAIIGFAGPGTYNLPNFTVNVTTDYVDLIFTAMDDLPLATSQRILVTALSRTKQYGSQFNADGTQITQIGSDALMMQPVQATITLRDGTAQGVQVLDFYGVPTGATVPVAGNTFTIDGRYASYYYQITRAAPGQPPTDIALSNASVPENQPAGTPVGTLSSSDPDVGDTFTYSLVSGTGGDDNARFAISGNQLRMAALFDYEAKNSYTVRIRTRDAGGSSFEKVFTIAVTNANDAPTDITLSNASVPENQPVGTVVGTLSSTDVDPGETFTYSLVSGPGGDDNASFVISGNQIQTTGSFDHEAKGSYTVRLRTTDSGGLSFEKAFTIAVTNRNDAPTDVQLSNLSVPQNRPAGIVVGVLSSTDPDLGDTFSYSLVSGAGSDDNASFAIRGGQLQTTATFHYDLKNSYTVRIRSTDAGGLFFEKVFTIAVTNVNAAPTDITLSNASVEENQPVGTVVGTFSSSDIDVGETFTYSLVSGDGSACNASFTISGNQLQTAAWFDYETVSNYTIRVRTTDARGASFEKVFTIAVTNMIEAPAAVQLSSLSVPEDQPIGTVVGLLSPAGMYRGETVSFSLVSGEGSSGNGNFRISGNRLVTAATFSYSPGRTYAVRIRLSDATGPRAENTFAIQVSSLLEFGQIDGKSARSLTVVDADSDLVTFRLSGGGMGALLGNQLSLIGTTSKSVLTISVRRQAGDGQYQLGGITSDGLIRSISAASAVLSGQVVLNSMQQSAGTAAVSLKFLVVRDGQIQAISLPVRSLSLLDWQDTDGTPDQLIAPAVGSISVSGRKLSRTAGALAGDLDAAVNVTGSIKSIRAAGTLTGAVTAGAAIGWVRAGALSGNITTGHDATGHGIGSITIGGDVSGSQVATSGLLGSVAAGGAIGASRIQAQAGIGSIRARALLDSDILAGVLPDFTKTFADRVDFATPSAMLGKLTVSGRKLAPGESHGAYVSNVHVSSPTIKALLLTNVATNDGAFEARVMSDTGTIRVGTLTPLLPGVTVLDAVRWAPGQTDRPLLVQVL